MFIWIAFFFALLAGVLAGLYAGLLHCKTGEKGGEAHTNKCAEGKEAAMDSETDPPAAPLP